MFRKDSTTAKKESCHGSHSNFIPHTSLVEMSQVQAHQLLTKRNIIAAVVLVLYFPSFFFLILICWFWTCFAKATTPCMTVFVCNNKHIILKRNEDERELQISPNKSWVLHFVVVFFEICRNLWKFNIDFEMIREEVLPEEVYLRSALWFVSFALLKSNNKNLIATR